MGQDYVLTRAPIHPAQLTPLNFEMSDSNIKVVGQLLLHCGFVQHITIT